MYLSKPATVVFDASNKEHRNAARAFLKRKAWVDSPLRFTQDPAYGSVSEQVQSKMLDWYVAQEEAAEAKKSEQSKSKKKPGQPKPSDDNKVCSFIPMKIRKI